MRISARTSVKFGLSGLVLSPIRLIITVLLSAVALGLFGSAISAYRFNEETAARDVLFSNDYTVIGSFSFENYKSLDEKTGGALVALVYDSHAAIDFYQFVYDALKYDEHCRRGTPSYIAYASGDFIENGICGITGRLPEKRDEIVLSSCMANCIIKGGYYDYINYPYDIYDLSTQNKVGVKEVTSAEELVEANCRITLNISDEETMEAVIVGVLFDGCDKNHSASEDNDDASYHDTIYVSEELFKELGEVGTIYGVSSGAYSEDLEDFYLSVNESENFEFYSVALSTLSAQMNTLKDTRKAFIGVGIGLAVFAMILIYQFISYSIQEKKGEIAILRALGARKSDVLSIYLMESLMLSVLQSAVAYIICASVISIINGAFSSIVKGMVFLRMDGLIVLAVFALSLVMSMLSAIVPIIRTANKSPVDAIRENQE